MRYVDICIIWHHDHASFLKEFNDLDQDIKFALKVENNSSLLFLVILLIRNNMNLSKSLNSSKIAAFDSLFKGHLYYVQIFILKKGA